MNAIVLKCRGETRLEWYQKSEKIFNEMQERSERFVEALNLIRKLLRVSRLQRLWESLDWLNSTKQSAVPKNSRLQMGHILPLWKTGEQFMLTMAEYLILREVALNPGSSVNEILRGVNSTSDKSFALGTAYGALHSAEKSGLVAATWDTPSPALEKEKSARTARPVRKYLITKKGLDRIEKQAQALAFDQTMVHAVV